MLDTATESPFERHGKHVILLPAGVANQEVGVSAQVVLSLGGETLF